MRDINSISNSINSMPWPQTGAIQYHAQLWLPDKGRVIKGVGCLQLLGSKAFWTGKRSGPRLLSTIPWDMTCNVIIKTVHNGTNSEWKYCCAGRRRRLGIWFLVDHKLRIVITPYARISDSISNGHFPSKQVSPTETT